MKNIFKITAIITALLFTLLASGCGETQEEKYNKLEKQYIKIANNLTEEFNKKKETLKPEEIGSEKAVNMTKELYEKFIKEEEPVLKEMEKVAKGNPKLEEKVESEKDAIEKMKIMINKINKGEMKTPW